MFLLVLVTIILAAVFLMISVMTPQQSAGPMTAIQAPDNSTGKAVPRLYGRALLYGNNIYYGGLSSYAIRVDSGK